MEGYDVRKIFRQAPESILKLGPYLIQALNLGLWLFYCLIYTVVFLSNWNALAPRMITYVCICSVLGVILCGAAWRFLISPALGSGKTVTPMTVAGLLGTAALFAAIHALLSVYVESEILRINGPKFSIFLMDLLSFLFIYCLVFCIGLALEMMNTDARRRERLALAESRASQAHLLALRLQLNPHFVFNALNAVSSLIVLERNGEAVETLQKLCRFVRVVTETPPHEFSPLSKELEMAEEYLAVESVRFQDRMSVSINAPIEIADTPVPNFILQPLVENAVKHGVGRSRSHTEIEISVSAREDGVRILVENRSDEPGEQLGQSALGMGIGLRNVRERLTALYGGFAEFSSSPTPDGYRVVLDLPGQLAVLRPQ